jgi:SNF2 family DNA or RNA helicase
MYLQGNARAHRAGQHNKVTVVRLQGSPVERRMYDMLDGKVDLHQGLVDLYKQEIA